MGQKKNLISGSNKLKFSLPKRERESRLEQKEEPLVTVKERSGQSLSLKICLEV